VDTDPSGPRRPTSGKGALTGGRPVLFLALAIYLISRGLLLYTAFDQVAVPAYELHPIGTVARDILGPSSSVPRWIYYDNAAGHYLTSPIAALLFRLFGPSYLALKLVSFVGMVPALLLLWSILRRTFGQRAAELGALLFALPPTTLAKYSLIVVGNHTENLPFLLLLLWAFLRAHRAAAPGSARWRFFLVGLCAGLNLLVFLGALLPIGLLFLTHLGLRGWRRTLADLPALVGGLALAASPLVLLNLTGESRGVGFLQAKFSGAGGGFDPGRTVRRTVAFFAVHLPRAGTYPDLALLPGRLAGWIFLACTAAALLVCLPPAWRAGRALLRGALGRGLEDPALGPVLLVPLMLLLPLTALAFARSNLVIGGHGPPIEAAGYRYFLPHFLTAMLLIAVAFGRLWDGGGWARRAGFLLASAALGTGLTTLTLIDPGAEPNLGAHYDGYNVRNHALSLQLKKNGLSKAQIVAYTESFMPLFRERIYFGLGFHNAWKAHMLGLPADLTELLAPYPEERRDDVARGVGALLAHRPVGGALVIPDAERLAVAWIESGLPHAERVPEGMCTSWDPPLDYEVPRHLVRNRQMLARAPAALREPLARGFGLDCGRLLRRGIGVERDWIAREIEQLPQDLRPAFFHGLGAGLADGREQPELSFELVPAELTRDVEAGYRERLGQLGD